MKKQAASTSKLTHARSFHSALCTGGWFQARQERTSLLQTRFPLAPAGRVPGRCQSSAWLWDALTAGPTEAAVLQPRSLTHVLPHRRKECLLSLECFQPSSLYKESKCLPPGASKPRAWISERRCEPPCSGGGQRARCSLSLI